MDPPSNSPQSSSSATNTSTEPDENGSVPETPCTEPDIAATDDRQVVPSSTVNQRRELLDSTLKDYRQAKMKRKLPMDAQLVGVAKEELALKKKLVEQMERTEKQHQDSISQLFSSMEKISGSIADGFSLLKTFLLPPPTHHQPQVYTPYPYTVLPPPGPGSYMDGAQHSGLNSHVPEPGPIPTHQMPPNNNNNYSS